MPLTDRFERPPRHADELRARRVAWVSAERMSTSVCACEGSEWEHVKTIARDANLLAPERSLGEEVTGLAKWAPLHRTLWYPE